MAGRGRKLSSFKPGAKIVARDKMGPGSGMPVKYTYVLSEPAGRNFRSDFKPAFSPGKMLALGVFSGKYLNDCRGEFPREWFEAAERRDKLRPGEPDARVNLFKVASRQPIRTWREKGWIPVAPGDRDARGWFQWYCRYWLGRRMEGVDDAQIARWKAYARHAGQIRASYAKMTPAQRKKVQSSRAEKMGHRPKQRQGLLQWAYDPFI